MKLTDDLTRGDWTRERFGPGWSVAGTVGSGFEAYARILHPVPASRVDLDVPRQLPYGMPTIVEETVWPWAELARRNGRSMHPLVQSRRLNDDESRMHFDDGWYCGQTRSGFLEPEYLADIVTRLTPETTTPGDLTVGVWEGWGELQGTGVVYTASGDDGSAQAAYDEAFRASVAPEVREALARTRYQPPRLFRRRPVVPPLLLELPDRRYLMFATDAAELSNPDWPLKAGIGWDDESEGVMPQLVWPADSAWCIASEIDFDFTLVGGTRAAIAAVLDSPLLETYEVQPDDDVSWDGDVVNEFREPAPQLRNPFA